MIRGIWQDVQLAFVSPWQMITGQVPALPATTAPAMRPAPAPQTAAKMITWTPDDWLESLAQRQQQYDADIATFRAAAAATVASNATVPDPTASNHTMLWVLGTAAALSTAVLIFRR